jgi:predicted acylesterase/phospholipase RssA
MAEMEASRGERSRVGLALAGGGLEGAVYEIGALRALDDSLDGLDIHRDVGVYVGVSAGAFIASCLANGLSTKQLVRAIVKQAGVQHPFTPEIFFTPAVKEYVQRSLMTPRLLTEAMLEYARSPEDLTLVESMARLSRALPVGLFDNDPIRSYLEGIFSLEGRTNDFRELGGRLVVVAADLDSGDAVRFGDRGHEHVPISKAVQASTALPGLYPPVLIDDRYYVDGVLLKTLHASVALDAAAELVICVNPIVPVDTADAVEAGVMRRGKLIDRGLPTVLSQTFRTLVHSRLTVGLSSYEPRYPGQRVVLLEPPRHDYKMFFTNIFRFSSRKTVCEHAYRGTRQQLVERREELEPIFAEFGIRYREKVLLDPTREVWDASGLGEPRPGTPVTEQLDDALTRLDALLDRIDVAEPVTD